MKQTFIKVTLYFLIPIIGMVTLLSLLILLVSTPPVWNPLYKRAMPKNMHEVYIHDAQLISEGMWQSTSYDDINANLKVSSLRRRLVLIEKEVKHFEDVRSIIHTFPYIAGLGLLTLCLWRFIFKQQIKWHFSLGYFLLLGGSLTIWGWIAWRHMFRTLHWWIFQNDSWILPKNCYTLKLFPYAAWQTASLTVVATLFLLLVGFSLPAGYRWIRGRNASAE